MKYSCIKLFRNSILHSQSSVTPIKVTSQEKLPKIQTKIKFPLFTLQTSSTLLFSTNLYASLVNSLGSRRHRGKSRKGIKKEKQKVLFQWNQKEIVNKCGLTIIAKSGEDLTVEVNLLRWKKLLSSFYFYFHSSKP